MAPRDTFIIGFNASLSIGATSHNVTDYFSSHLGTGTL